jgi:glycosyltransferase involved in cell wall biosynthesis
MPRLYVLLPAYNESANIGAVVRDVLAQRSASVLEGVELTAVVVDDGSKDDTGKLAAEAGAVVLRHPQNRGVGAGFRTGLEHAQADGVEYLVHMDSDGQFHAEDIPRVVEPVLADRCDFALGSRFVPGEPPVPNLARWKGLMLHAVARGVGVLTGYRLTDLSCGLRCMNRKVIEAVNPSFDYDYIQETLVQALAAGARVEDVPVAPIYEIEPSKPGMSSRTLRYGRRFLGLTAYSLFNFYRAKLQR